MADFLGIRGINTNCNNVAPNLTLCLPFAFLYYKLRLIQ